MQKQTSPTPLRPKARQAGFSIIELMVSIVVGLVIVASLSLLFANNSRARQEMEKTSQQIENGRYSTQMLRDDLRLAGYYGEFTPSQLGTSTSVPDPSATDDATVTAALPFPVQGYHFGMSSASTLPAGVNTLLTDRRPNSDVLVIRRASTCFSGPTAAESSCSTMDTTLLKYFQTTLCANHLTNVSNPANLFVISENSAVFSTLNPALSGVTPAYLAQKDCTTPAVTRAFYVHIYYVANNDVPGDGIPTLKVVSLGSTAFNPPAAIAEGIETIQIEYGMDTNGDGMPDAWKPDPSAGAPNAAAAALAWSQVTTVKLHVLARNTVQSGQFTDARSYVLGSTASTDNTFGAYNDSYKRHVYTTVARLVNVAGRLQ